MGTQDLSVLLLSKGDTEYQIMQKAGENARTEHITKAEDII
jgi:hypothetical protein